jgi:hypothetical protein
MNFFEGFFVKQIFSIRNPACSFGIVDVVLRKEKRRKCV